jgi:outer membrane protein assembly factor BamB
VDRAFRFAADGIPVGTPIVENDGTVYCATDGGTLYAVTPSGAVRWNARLGGRPVLLFKTRDGIMLIATGKGRIEGYNRRGAKVVDFSVDPEGKGILSVFEAPGGRVLAALKDGSFHLYTIAGKRLLSWKVPVPYSCPPVLSSDGHIAYGTEDGRILVYGLSGVKIREYPAGSRVRALAWEGDGSIAAALRDGGVAFFSPEGTVFDGGTFQEHLDFLRPLSSGETLALGTSGDLFLLGPDKRERWSFRGRGILGFTHDEEGNIFTVGNTGQISGLDIRGNRLWTSSLPGFTGGPGISENGRYLAVGSSDWVLNMFEFLRFGEKPLALEKKNFSEGPLNTDPARSVYKRDLDYIFLMERASSPYLNRKSECIAELEDRFNRGRMGKSLDYASEVLAYIILEPYPGRGFSGMRSAPDLPDIRIRAVRLMGRLGSRIDGKFLLELLSFEPDTSVVTEIIRALGVMRRDPDRAIRQGILVSLFSSAALPPSPAAYGVLETLEAIVEFQGQELGLEERSILFSIMAGAYPRDLKRAAEELSRKK